MNKKNFGSTGAREVYESILRGNYNRAANIWFSTKNSFAPLNRSILDAKLLKTINKRELYRQAINKRNKNMKKYYNTKLASKLLKIERKIKSNRTKLGGIQPNTKTQLSAILSESNNTKERLLKILEREVSNSIGRRGIVPISNLTRINYKNNPNARASNYKRTRTTSRSYSSTLF